MTKEITKAIILQELQDKFQLRDFDPAKFLFDETVIPTYEITPHLTHTTAKMVDHVFTGIGGFVFITLPSDEKWIVTGYTVVFVTTGNLTLSGVFIARKARVGGSTFTYLDLTAGIAASYTHYLATPLRLDPGDAIGVNCDGYTTDTTIQLYVDYTMEEMR